ncbi:FRIGIDA-like protein 3 isoform X2 [Magnolia sinica]|uniref:FRIGIDA-like protein 3 isoform X2 n=1 Tax=Magnolia sinica TaxID=86752 RepID=UPI00265882E4|nr:FRIGIDA-like protein 3 isoform X2 [Magnolia sinica]
MGVGEPRAESREWGTTEAVGTGFGGQEFFEPSSRVGGVTVEPHQIIAMVDTEQFPTGTELIGSTIEQLGKAFADLESLRKGSSDHKVQWKEIEEYFSDLERTLKKRCDELAEKERVFEEEESETRALLVQREAEVAAKEQASLDRLQELKDAAVAAISEAREKYKMEFPEPAIIQTNKAAKVSSSSNGDPIAPVSVPEEKSPDKSGGHADIVAAEVKPRPELTHELMQFCEQMDIKGILKFISDNRRDLAAIREEIPIAWKSATKPARLVLDALEGFYPPDQTNHQENKKDAALQGLRRSCVMLMESVAPLLVGSDSEPSADHPLSSETKQQAKAIADEWKTKLMSADVDSANGNSLEAQAFLQLLATFSIASEFDEDVLCKLVLDVAHLRQTPDLCRSLGLTHKMPGVVEELVNSGKQIDAIHFVQAFQLTETFPPVPLLKTYLKDLRRNSNRTGGNSGATVMQVHIGLQIEELAALRAVIRCIEEYKLESEYPLDPLQRRVSQLEKAKSDKKRMGDGAKPPPKRPWPNGGFVPRMPFVSADRQPQTYGNMGGYRGGTARYQYTANSATYDYEVAGQGVYGHQQSNAPRPNYHPHESVPVTSFGGALSNYGSHTGSGLQPSHQPYM